MRLSKYFVFLSVITCFSLLYTHQKFLLIRANYSMRDYDRELAHLLDHNKKLMYNVTTLESPANLEAKLSATGTDYHMPVRWTVVKRLKSEPAYKVAKVAERRNVVLDSIVNFLTLKAEARAFEN